MLGETDSILRARVLGRLAKALQAEPDPDRRAGLSETAVAMARRIGDPARASSLYELLAPYADHHVLAARLPLGTLGSCRQYLGLLAAAMGRWDDALAQFEAAVEAHERIGALPLQARSPHHYASALLARGRPDDRPLAQQHLDWASGVSGRLGMRRLAIGAPYP